MVANIKSRLSELKDSPKYRYLILANVSVGTFMSTLDSSIVNVALPTISTQLHTDLSTLQWVVTAYLLTITSLLPIFGRVADLIGRKKIFSLGFILFTLGSLLCGLADNIWMLVGMRIFQALGASMLMSNSAAIITANFPPQERGRALGLTGTVVALGNLSGPAIGGLIISFTGWRSIFWINLPIGILGYLAAQMVLPKDKPQRGEETFDILGAIFFTLGMLSLLFAINNGQDRGWTSPVILLGLFLGILLLSLFLRWETKVSHPMIDLSLFRNRPFLIGNLSGFLSFAALFTNTMLMPFYLQHVLNYQPLHVGLMMSVFPIVMIFVAPISGHVSDRIGPVALTTSGLLITALGLFYLTSVSATSTALQIFPGPLLIGLGSSLFQSPNNSSVMSSVPKPKLGLAGGINALVRNLGMVVGIALSVTLFENRQAAALRGIGNATSAQQTSSFLIAYHTVLFVGAALALIGAIISLNRKGYALAETSTPRPKS
ncbi:MFS transporter [Desulfitobacterium sp.]|uniref:MFS transporter n=1 Tax=Desulfitobacterium sp. TaxID=49981 RepID=UPI002CAC26E6|nr:MFS transporter [Desulfitobacterium sp.]HVJ48280.1 MFS transporter [Desulfitobacterium sp.]